MFEALINGRIDTCGLDFEVSFADIEQLNARTLAHDTDVCKISFAILPLITESYRMLSSGSALGRGNGPLLVAREAINLSDENLRVAIPGEHTTANLLIQRLFPSLRNRTPVLFSEIAERVTSGEFDAGVLIHEGRFTYTNKKLYLCADLGVEWEQRTAMPLPLGGIAVARNLGDEVAKTVENIVRASVEYALTHPEVSRDFVRKHAQEMDETVISSHIALFVNEFSVDVGDIGRQAIEALTGVSI
jgi:1,4-dihydroxy-6-naphthoate synthase